METQVRSTDPLTSRMAKKSSSLDAHILCVLRERGPKTSWELVLELNKDRQETAHLNPDQPTHEITIDSVSTCMRPLCRQGKVHEVGTKENTVRGTFNQVIVWAAGPPEGWTPGSSMPAKATGPRNQKLIPDLNFTVFLPGEVRAKLSELTSVDQFTLWLNQELVKRVEMTFE